MFAAINIGGVTNTDADVVHSADAALRRVHVSMTED